MKMSRRDTILIAVLINAGLLTILFATAVSHQESVENVSYSAGARASTEIAIAEPAPQIKQVIQNQQEKRTAESRHITPREQQPFFVIHIAKGDSLKKLAYAYHVPKEKILAFNQLSNEKLKVGQTLKIPFQRGGVQAEEERVIAEAVPTAQETYREYVVAPGDNPWLIARKNKISLNELLEVNQLDSQSAKQLRPGMRLLLPPAHH